jgi:hypothetical protein
MATSGPAASTYVSSVFVPNLENHFGVPFYNPFSSPGWNNPYARAIIKPYVPSDDQEMALTCQKVLNSNMPDILTGADNATGSKFSFDPVTRNVMSLLDPKDLANFSEASKCCYSASKANFIWEVQLHKIFPNVKVMNNSLCSFSSEQQFKIYFKRMNDELKPYICQFKLQDDLLKGLRGPNGMDGTIDAAWKDMVQNGGIEDANEALNYVEAPWNFPNANEFQRSRVQGALYIYRRLNYERIAFAGDNYNGTVETIAPSSYQGRCLTAINILVPKAFDDQERFEKTMQRTEAAKNGTSETTADPFKPVYAYVNHVTTDTFAPGTTGNANPDTDDQNNDCIIS